MRNKFLKVVGVTGFVLLLLAGTFEGLLRLLIPSPPFSSLFSFRPHMTLKMTPNIRGVSKNGVHSTNAFGMRGNEPPKNWNDTKTILAVGGSTTQCFFLDDQKIWSQVLQRELEKNGAKVWVGNAGIDGHSTRSHVLLMEDLLPQIKPKMVVALVGINDMLISLSEDVRFQKNRFDRRSIKSILYSKSKLFQVIYTWKLILWDQVQVTQANAHLTLKETPFDPKTETLPANLRDLIPTISEFENNLKAMAQLARDQNVKLVFMTQPSLFDDTDHWRRVEGNFYWIKKAKHNMSAATYWRLLNEYNQVTLKVCREENLECLDVASFIPHREDMFYDAVHFTELGSERVGLLLAEFLLPSVR